MLDTRHVFDQRYRLVKYRKTPFDLISHKREWKIKLLSLSFIYVSHNIKKSHLLLKLLVLPRINTKITICVTSVKSLFLFHRSFLPNSFSLYHQPWNSRWGIKLLFYFHFNLFSQLLWFFWIKIVFYGISMLQGLQ